MDFWTFLGGLTMGAAAAAIYDMSSGPKMLGQSSSFDADDEEKDLENDPPGGVSASVGPSSGGGGPSVFVGPPSGGGGMGPSGPSVSVMPSNQSSMAPPVGGPTVSVTPIVQPGAFDQSFFGVGGSSWFWPANYWPYRTPQDQTYICKKTKTPEGEDSFVCEPKFPRPYVNYTYGAPGWW